MKLIITIDTEEDSWNGYSPANNTVRNIERVPALQEMFDRFGVRPTYLVTYPVAADEKAASILKAVLDRGGCEIGAHCHPWNTPPFEEEINKSNTMLCNLPKGLQFKKLRVLDEAIKKSFGIKPTSFRCGRWGYNRDVAENLQRLGYKVDTSIAAYTDWSAYDGPDFSTIPPGPFRFSADDILKEQPGGPLAEVPATVGFLQRRYALSNRILRAVSRRPVKRPRLSGILYRLNIVNKVWLSPEFSDAATMIRLAGTMKKNNYAFLNMSFHSPNLIAGLTPFVRTKEAEKDFLDRTNEFLKFACAEGIESITLSESLKYL